jgi:hypothetical protein
MIIIFYDDGESLKQKKIFFGFKDHEKKIQRKRKK